MSTKPIPTVRDLTSMPAAPVVARNLRAALVQRVSGTIPTFRLQTDGSSDFTAGDTLTIGNDVYEFVAEDGSVANDGNIAVQVMGELNSTLNEFVQAVNGAASAEHANITMDDGETPAIGVGTENIVATKFATTVFLRYADAPGGDPAVGAPSIVLAESCTQAATIWSVGNVNLTTIGGRADSENPIAMSVVVVTAAMIANGHEFEFPFSVASFIVQARSAAGVPRAGGTDTFNIFNTTQVKVVFGGDAAPDIQATDILTITAFG